MGPRAMAAHFKGIAEASEHPSKQSNRNTGLAGPPSSLTLAMTTSVKVGLFGGRGNDKDIDPSQLPRTLEKIEIWSSADGPKSGAVITGIRFTYVDTDGKQHVVPGPYDAWGTTQGISHEPFKVATTEQDYVNKIGGSIGTAPDGDVGITSLTFTTSRGKTATYGDPKNGIPFTLPLDNGGVFAFFASAKTYLNAVGFYVQTYP